MKIFQFPNCSFTTLQRFPNGAQIGSEVRLISLGMGSRVRWVWKDPKLTWSLRILILSHSHLGRLFPLMQVIFGYITKCIFINSKSYLFHIYLFIYLILRVIWSYFSMTGSIQHSVNGNICIARMHIWSGTLRAGLGHGGIEVWAICQDTKWAARLQIPRAAWIEPRKLPNCAYNRNQHECDVWDHFRHSESSCFFQINSSSIFHDLQRCLIC
jgi:hypothetical protein